MKTATFRYTSQEYYIKFNAHQNEMYAASIKQTENSFVNSKQFDSCASDSTKPLDETVSRNESTLTWLFQIKIKADV